MRRFTALTLAAVLLMTALFLSTSCGKKTYELTLVTASGGVTDKAYGQGCWNGMARLATEKNISCRYIVPASLESDVLYEAVVSAAADGSKTVVCAGGVFSNAVYKAQGEYPDVRFILVDATPSSEDGNITNTAKNTASLLYCTQQAGFLAGYAAVLDGHTSLGFIGGIPNDDVAAYGYGFLQGADYAADILGETVNITYHYTGDFNENEANEKTAEKMYEDGCEVIFAACGDAYKSVIKAAETKRGAVMASDVDRRYDSSAVVTSAVKGISSSVYSVLRSIYDVKDFESVYGGKTTYFDASVGGVGLAESVINDSNGDAFDRFYKFTKADYENIYSRLSSGSLSVIGKITLLSDAGYPTEEELVSALSLKAVSLNVMQ